MPAVDHDMALLDRYLRLQDEEAFAAIVKRYAGMVYHTTLRVLGDNARAEEVAQETFFQLVKRGDTVKQSLAGWLHRTATRLAIDTLRSDGARKVRESAYHTVNPKDVDRWQELSPHIDEALAEMPEESRDLLVKHFLEGRTQSQLALELNVSRPTVNRRVRSALDDLRQRLGKMGITATVTAVFLSCQNVSHAADAAVPLSLSSELGKMSLISGGQTMAVGASAKAQWLDVWLALRSLLPATFGTCAVAAVVAGVIFTIVQLQTGNNGNNSPSPPNTAVMPLPVSTEAREESAHEPQADGSFPCVIVGGDLSDLSSDRIVMFQHPDSATNGQIMVAFGDSHVEYLTKDELKERIENQTGVVFENFIAQSDVIELDELTANMQDVAPSAGKSNFSSGNP